MTTVLLTFAIAVFLADVLAQIARTLAVKAQTDATDLLREEIAEQNRLTVWQANRGARWQG